MSNGETEGLDWHIRVERNCGHDDEEGCDCRVFSVKVYEFDAEGQPHRLGFVEEAE